MFNKSIAIIDDDPVLLNIYSEALMMSGYDVCSFSNPLVAYDHIKENPDKYSLLITDYRMPQMNGLRLATELLEINKNMNVIIMVNDHDDIECNYKFNIIKKPISIPKLIRFVNESISISMSSNNKF